MATTYAERLKALSELSHEDLATIVLASAKTIAEDRARGFTPMSEVRQRLEAAWELLTERAES